MLHSLFVPNPNMSTVQIVLDDLNNKKYAGRKKGRISYPEEQEEGVVSVF